MKQPAIDFRDFTKFPKIKILLIPLVFLFVMPLLFAQPQTYFRRAWFETDASIAPGFTNSIVSTTNSTAYAYVAGSTLNSSSTHSLNLSKFSRTGVLQWSAQYTANTSGDVYIGGITLDASENVIITGSAYNGTTNNYDLLVIKYNSSGTEQWHYLLDGGFHGNEGGAAAVCDGSDNVYVTGVVWTAALNPDAVTICLNSSGSLQWKSAFDNVSLVDAGTSIVLSSGNVVVSGITQTSISNWEYLTARYNQSTGGLLGSNVTTLGGTTIDHAMAVTLDGSGNIYITGALGSTGTGLNVKTIKLNASLSILWTATWAGSSNLDDEGNGIAVDASGNVIVAGYTTTGSNRDALLLKYSSSGTLTSTITYDAEGGDDEFSGLALSSTGDIFAGGYVTRKGNKDFYSAFYSSGALVWSDVYNGIYNKDDAIRQVTPDGSGNFIVAGMTGRANGGQSVTLIKYERTTLVKPQNEYVTAPFIENRGQLLNSSGRVENDVRFYSNSTYPNVYLQDNIISYVFSHIDIDTATTDTMVRVDLKFYTSSTASPALVVGMEEQDDFHNYYLGHTPDGLERVPLNKKVLQPDIYTNIDALYGQGPDGLFIRLMCKPGSDPSDIKLQFSGNTALSVLSNGNLKVETALESLILPRPAAMTVASDGTELSTSWTPTYSIGSDGKVSIATGTYDTGKTLVIKTGRDRGAPNDACGYWSTYFGDTGNESALGNDVRHDNNDMFFCGKTTSIFFPVTIGATQGILKGTIDAFASCFKQLDQRRWVTYYGGNDNDNFFGNDVAYAIKYNAANSCVYFVGSTSTSDFKRLHENLPGEYLSDDLYSTNTSEWYSRGFIVKLTAIDGTARWATLFGDSHRKYDAVVALDVLQNGNIAVGGYSNTAGTYTNSNFPTTFSGSQHHQSAGAAYVAEIGTNNNIVWATKLTNEASSIIASYPTAVYDITEDGNSNLLLTGLINDDDNTDNIPTGSNTLTYKGGRECFIMRFSNARTLIWSTFFGGTNDDWPNSILCDNNNNVILTGTTASSQSEGFPVKSVGNASNILLNDVSYNGGSSDIFVSKFQSNGAQIWCRYLGGDGLDQQGHLYYAESPYIFQSAGNGATLDGDGTLYLTGNVQNNFTPITGQNNCIFFYPKINNMPNTTGGSDAIITVIKSDNTTQFSSYWGGWNPGHPNEDFGHTIAIGQSSGKQFTLIGGITNSTTYPDNSSTIPVCFEDNDHYFNQDLINPMGNGWDAFISKVYLDGCVGIDEIQSAIQSLELIPNPAVDFIFIKSTNEDNGLCSIKVFDASGKDVTSFVKLAPTDAQGKVTLQIGGLASGFYYLSAMSGEKAFSGKFIKI